MRIETCRCKTPDGWDPARGVCKACDKAIPRTVLMPSNMASDSELDTWERNAHPGSALARTIRRVRLEQWKVNYLLAEKE